MSGWIKLHRQIRNHWLWDDPVYLHGWVNVLMECNHQEKKVLINGCLLECKRGQKLYSLGTWSKVLGKRWTIQKVRTFFKLLENDAMIECEGLQKTTRLTVLNYTTYQDEQQTNNKQVTSSQQTANKQVTDKQQQLKKGKNEKNEKKKEVFEKFWEAYPKRNNKRVGRKSTFDIFKKIPENEFDRLIQNTKNYSQKIGDYAKDPERFLKKDYWKDWEEVEETFTDEQILKMTASDYFKENGDFKSEAHKKAKLRFYEIAEDMNV